MMPLQVLLTVIAIISASKASQLIFPQAGNKCLNDTYHILDLAAGQGGVIASDSSGNVSRNYENLSTCTFAISARNPDARIRLDFEYSILECGFDKITIFDGNTNSSAPPIVAEMTGRRVYAHSPPALKNSVPLNTPDVIISTGNSLMVEFKSDTYVTAAGFRANFTVLGIHGTPFLIIRRRV